MASEDLLRFLKEMDLALKRHAQPGETLDLHLPHDLAVTKLRRFHQGDRQDIQILFDTGLVGAETLRERLDSAHSFSDRDEPSVVTAFKNLEVVVDYLAGYRKRI